MRFIVVCFVMFEAYFITFNKILIYISVVLYVVYDMYLLHVAMAYQMTVI